MAEIPSIHDNTPVLIRQTESFGLVWYQSPLLLAAGTPHAFSTRIGGVSPPPFDSLNMGNPSGSPLQDEAVRIMRNYLLLQEAIGAKDRTVLRVHQVHGNALIVAGESGEWDSCVKADAIVVTRADQLASVRIADCTPVLLAVEDGSAVAAVHAGWRGVIAGVVTRAMEQLNRLRPRKRIIAAIGPCIGIDSFEVGPEVLGEFRSAFGAEAPIRLRADGKGYVDLRQAIVRQLIAGGVDEARIESTDRCTFRDNDEFFSHRRDQGVTGRMTALIGVKMRKLR